MMIMDRHLWTGLGIGVVVTAGLLVSCAQDDDVAAEPREIGFTSAMPVREYITRGELKDFYEDFKIFGTKTMEGASTPTAMMSNYGVKYVDNAWQYVTGRQDTYPGQIEKFWDFMASEYHFIAGSPYGKTSIASATRLTISDLVATSTQSTSYDITSNYFFSEPMKVEKSDFNKTVDMVFRPVMTQVIVAFVYADEQVEEQTLANITFQPQSGGTYNAKGSVTLDYDFTDCSYSVSVDATEKESAELMFESVTMDVPCTTTTPSKTVWYLLPYSQDDANLKPWTLTIGSLADNNTADVPAEYMHWKPGYKYVYVFKLNNTEVDPGVRFVNMIQMAVTGWEEATSADIYIWNW